MIIRAGGVELQEGVGQITEAPARLLDELRGVARIDAERFVAIGSYEHRHIDMPAFREYEAGIVGNDPAVHNGAGAAPALENLIGGQRSQFSHRFHAEAFGVFDADLFCVHQGADASDGDTAPAAAFADRAVEQSFGLWNGHKVRDESRAGGLAEDGHALRIAAERDDVSLYPLQRGDHVHDAEVARAAAVGFLGQLGIREESEQAKAGVQGQHHGALPGQYLAIVLGLRAGAGVVPAAINPDHDRTLVGRGFRSGPDVEVKAILAHLLHGRDGRLLHPDGTELVCFADAFPMRNRLRGAAAQKPNRRSREGNASVDAHLRAGRGDPGYLPGVEFHGIIDRRMSSCAYEREKKSERARHEYYGSSWL